MGSEAGRARKLRERLGHPVVDADGHWLEFGSLVGEQMKRIGGDLAAEGFAYYTSKVVKEVLDLSIEERRQRGERCRSSRRIDIAVTQQALD